MPQDLGNVGLRSRKISAEKEREKDRQLLLGSEVEFSSKGLSRVNNYACIENRLNHDEVLHNLHHSSCNNLVRVRKYIIHYLLCLLRQIHRIY